MRSFVLCIAAVAAIFVASSFADEFPKPYNSGVDKAATPPLTPEEAVKKIRLPAGFKATLFAGEPDVQNPIACAWDSRGRLWIAENYTYAEADKMFDHSLRDRILIFEDTDNDGRHDKRTVFADNLKNLTSIELGYGGVYATAAPHLLFIPDKNRDDKPDAAPEVLLDGFDEWGSRHNFVNGLKWGPDGWLYGRHGILATSNVGRPGAPDSERVKFNCCIWRFHPVRKTVEVVTWGGTNAWGHDWNAEGEGFFINTVIGHLYHMIPGAHYERMYGEDLNPHIYELLPQTADHYHFDTSRSWTESRDGKANDLGGGHAHSGLMIYQGENWPEQYRGKVFTINLHGRRINVERLERKGSGYTAKHEPDFAFFDDPWFRGVDLTYGPDGGVYVLDWSDQGECHENDGVHRTSGRIYKITYGEVKKPDLGPNQNLSVIPDDELLRLAVSSSNEWLSRRARQLLIQHAIVPHQHEAILAEVLKRSRSLVDQNDGYSRVELSRFLFVRAAMWSNLTAIVPPRKAINDTWLAGAEDSPSGWNVPVEHRQKISELAQGGSVFERHSARRDPDFAILLIRSNRARPATGSSLYYHEDAYDMDGRRDFDLWMLSEIVRVQQSLDAIAKSHPTEGNVIASYLNRRMLVELKRLAEDSRLAGDLPIQQLLWKALEFGAASDPHTDSLAQFAARTEVAGIRRFAARRLAEDLQTHPERLGELLALAELYFDEAKAKEITRGLVEAMRGLNKVAPPPHWTAFAAKAGKVPALGDDIRKLNVIFGDGRALNEICDIALDDKADLPARRQALETLITSKAPDLRKVAEKLITHRDLAHTAIRGLAMFDDPAAAKLAIANWNTVRWDAHAAVISDFATRPVFTRALLDAIAAGKIEREELTPYHARQIAALNNPEITAQLTKVWGDVRTTTEEKKKRITELKAALPPEAIAKADLQKGREVFTQACAACHRLFDLGAEGTQLGPNLTGSGRQDINYLLENIVDPNALVPADYKLSILTLKDGRTLSGFISAQNEQTLTLRTMTDTQTLPKADVAKTETSPHSLMPEGLLDTFNPEQIRDLFGFLMKK